MHITPRQIVFGVLAGAAGAAIGGSHILCPSGECPLSGSWYGTGTIGAALGFFYAETLPIGLGGSEGREDDEDDPSPGAFEPADPEDDQVM